MNDRIKLAEAMGITLHNRWDPLTDANDDYAVLEWMLNGPEHYFESFEVERALQWDYKIGDYARAALKVIE